MLLDFLAQATSDSELLKQNIEFLKEQIKFLEKANSDLVGTFKFFVGIAGSSIVLSVVAFWKNLNEAKKIIDSSVKEAVDRRISTALESRIDDIERTVLTEIRVRETRVDYWIPQLGLAQPSEFQILEARGFQRLKCINGDTFQQRFGDVVVVDLNCFRPKEREIPENLTKEQQTAIAKENETAKAESEAKIAATLGQITGRMTDRDVLIPYITWHSGEINKIRQRGLVRNFLPATSPMSLMSNVVDAAYFAHAQHIKAS
jgi:hypothetical protein